MTDAPLPLVPIFDGHNDTILAMRNSGRSFFERTDSGHLDLPRARDGGMAGGCFAVFVPDPDHNPTADPDADPDVDRYMSYDTMPPAMSLEYAQGYAIETLAALARVARASDGAVRIVETADDLSASIVDGAFAIELHLEGAEPIAPDLNTLDLFYRAGLRSIGLVWSRPNAFATGVPFKFPGSPDTGPGLTDAGKALVKACNELGILIDLSHLDEAGFWDVAAISTAPLVATHSGVHAICPSTRNLTDRQLDAIRDSEGIVGVNFHVGFLRPDGESDAATTTVANIADHVDYMVDRIGLDKVALGSDFDGALMPADLADAAGLPRLTAELRGRGYDDVALDSIGYQNWLRIFDRTW